MESKWPFFAAGDFSAHEAGHIRHSARATVTSGKPKDSEYLCNKAAPLASLSAAVLGCQPSAKFSPNCLVLEGRQKIILIKSISNFKIVTTSCSIFNVFNFILGLNRVQCLSGRELVPVLTISSSDWKLLLRPPRSKTSSRAVPWISSWEDTYFSKIQCIPHAAGLELL